ncbi:hypothetical protein DL240_05320 [Lujinxingia litoralis]|uniref:Uncharacterized protein n=1 Tax=Lujinxingia litoralis TaxID=2211119 RepID=A0A328C7P9_9DELT|nr:hypothetical protein [Lujinxingia litoralis]RAL23580.1 hypothetical protein DL240_05320 [Lujinxingia litoralis]
MANLRGPIQQLENELGALSRELVRVEAHIRRGEFRAARARLSGLRTQLELSEDSSGPANQLAVIGAQVGLMSGGSDWLRGRLPAALLCAAGGWLYGQSLLEGRRREMAELRAHVAGLDARVEQEIAASEAPPRNAPEA